MNPESAIKSTNLKWLNAKGFFDDRDYVKALDVYKELVEQQLNEGLSGAAVDSWLKVVYCLVMLSEVKESKEYIAKYEEIIRRISSRHWNVGVALALALEKKNPEPLRIAAEHFSQAWKEYRFSEFPRLFQEFERQLVSEDNSATINDYSVTSFTLWIDGLGFLAGRKYEEGLESIIKSYERYKYAGLMGDAAWSWYDTVISYLFLKQHDKARAFYNDHLQPAQTIGSRFVIIADHMFAAYESKDSSSVEKAMHIMAHDWLGYQDSNYPKIFSNFEADVVGSKALHADYSVSAYSVWSKGIELLSLSFPQKAISEFTTAQKTYQQLGFKEVVAWLTFSIGISHMYSGDLDLAREYIGSNLPDFQSISSQTLQATRSLLHALEQKDPNALDQALQICLQFSDLPKKEEFLSIRERLKTELVLSSNTNKYSRNTPSTHHKFGEWKPQLNGLRVELNIERTGSEYEISLVEPGQVIQRKPLRKRIGIDELENVLSSLTKLALSVDGVRRGMRIQLNAPEKEILKNINLLQEFESLGRVMFHLLLPKEIRSRLQDIEKNSNIVLKLDDQLIQYPWELMLNGSSHICLQHNISRVITSDKFYVNQVSRPAKNKLRFLVVGDPLQDDPDRTLPNARAEAISISEELSKFEHVDVKLLLGPQATTTNVLSELATGYDLFHFAGHVEHDHELGESSLVLSNNNLQASTIKSFIEDSPPLLVFINACESGKESLWEDQAIDYENRVFGMASAFLSAGCYYLGSIWPVHDKPAIKFAQKVYNNFFGEHQTLGVSVRLARIDGRDEFGTRDVSWASYVLYGDPILFMED